MSELRLEAQAGDLLVARPNITAKPRPAEQVGAALWVQPSLGRAALWLLVAEPSSPANRRQRQRARSLPMPEMVAALLLSLTETPISHLHRGLVC